MLLPVLLLTLLWSQPSVQSQQTSSVTEPQVLSSPELRVVLGQLYELRALRIEVISLKTNQEAEAKQVEAERLLWERKLELEQKALELQKQETALRERELQLANDQLMFYRTSYEVCVNNKKTGGWCKFKRILTLGIARCR